MRGKRDDEHDDLYRIAPFNTTVGLEYSANRWGLSLEGVYYDDQDKVSDFNGELPTDSYTLVNLGAWWQLQPGLRLAAGVDNLFDENYQEHLAGLNLVAGNQDLAVGERLPGTGVNGFVRVDYRF